MLKTIKKNVHMRLDELIKYVWENSVNEKRVFLGNHGQRVVFDNVGGFYPSGYAYSPDTTFSVEVEEEITEDTVFELLIELFFDGEEYYSLEFTNKSIGYVKNKETTSIYGLIDGKLQLIWEREEECWKLLK